MRRTAVALAAFLAAGGVGAAAPAPLDHTAHVLADRLAAGWNDFEAPNLARMRTWWAGRAPATYTTVFYPFGGPDIANALALFPDADTYLLFGLEDPGAIPELDAMSDDQVAAGVDDLGAALGELFQVNYFFTKGMEKRLGRGPFSNVTGLLLFFLATSECEVTGAKPIAVGKIPGIEIAFRRAGRKPQTVRYLAVNVADANLAKRSAELVRYLKAQGRFATMIKSAQYLMHEDRISAPVRFETIRALILAQSDFIVQDDSGIPLRLFARDRWKLQFHGKYDAPTPEFSVHLQKDLRIEMQRNSSGKLPFSYGYAYRRGESNLMTAELR